MLTWFVRRYAPTHAMAKPITKSPRPPGVPPASRKLSAIEVEDSRRNRSMRHRVDDVVDAEANPERRNPLGVARVVGELPGIADIVIEGHRHHDAIVLVVDPHPVSLGARGALPHAAAARVEGP